MEFNRYTPKQLLEYALVQINREAKLDVSSQKVTSKRAKNLIPRYEAAIAILEEEELIKKPF